MPELGPGLRTNPRPNTRRRLSACLPLGVFALVVISLLMTGATGATAATGLAYLKIGAGARSVALGNAVVSDIDDPSATYWNPGALSLMQDGTEAELMHNESFQSVRYEFATLTHSWDRHGFGAAFHGVWTDQLKGYDESARYLGEFSVSGVALSASYSFEVMENVGIGAGIEFLREIIDIDDASGAAFNFGVQARELLPRTSIGLAILHAGSPVSYITEEIDLPLTVQGGVSYWMPIDALNGTWRLAAEVRDVRDEETQLLFGTEYRYRDFTRLQVGYQTEHDTQDVSFGVGVGRESIRGQYAFVPFGEDLGEQHRFSVLISW